MTKLTKRVLRKTGALRYEKGKLRNIVISLEPPSLIGARLEGTRETYYVDAESVYTLGVKAYVGAVNKRVKQLRKQGVRSALTQARKELKGGVE